MQELALKENSIVWDIGTCTGSVAIEAAKIAREGAVYAIEKNEGDLENCFKNQWKHRTDFVAVLGKAPDRLDEFPDPDAIFIGGNGGNMEHLLQTCISRLQHNGRLVMNIATIENLAEALQHLKAFGCEVSILQAQISKSKPILHLTRFEPLNPIFIVTAKKGRGIMRTGTLYGVGVGPGDPELITVKAFRKLQESPVIAYPKKLRGSKSYAHRIVEVYIHPAEKEMLGLVFPMTKDEDTLRAEWEKSVERYVSLLSSRERCRVCDRRGSDVFQHLYSCDERHENDAPRGPD